MKCFFMQTLPTLYQKLPNKTHKHSRKALSHSGAPKWIETMTNEISRLKSRNSWSVTYLPKDANIVGSCFVYRVKRDADNKISSYRAQFVAQGYLQVGGADYHFDDTFALVACLETCRALLALAARND